MNRVTKPILKNKSHDYIFFNEKHDLHVLNFFGTLAYAPTIQFHRTKLHYRVATNFFKGKTSIKP